MPLQNALLEMTEKGFGMTTVTDADGTLIGVFTDGDLRRVLDTNVDLNSVTIEEVMSNSPKNHIKQPAGSRGSINHGKIEYHCACYCR